MYRGKELSVVDTRRSRSDRFSGNLLSQEPAIGVAGPRSVFCSSADDAHVNTLSSYEERLAAGYPKKVFIVDVEKIWPILLDPGKEFFQQRQSGGKEILKRRMKID
jgi:hypothetical protein